MIATLTELKAFNPRSVMCEDCKTQRSIVANSEVEVDYEWENGKVSASTFRQSEKRSVCSECLVKWTKAVLAKNANVLQRITTVNT